LINRFILRRVEKIIIQRDYRVQKSYFFRKGNVFILYFCITYGDASLSAVSSAIAAIEQAVPASVNNRKQQSNRYKRDVITKTLDDPENCIRQCDDAEDKLIMTATKKNAPKLAAAALEDNENATTFEQFTLTQQIEEHFADLGPLFQDFCSAAKKTDDCFSKCPDSQLKKLILIKHDDAQMFCEPQNNWSNYSEYCTAIICSNNTHTDNPSEGQCGNEKDIQTVTNFDLSENSPDNDGYALTYEADAKKNDATVATTCKIYTCELDFYKPIITKKCGAKSYDLFVRLTQLDPRKGLNLLKEVNAVDSVKECKQFQ